MELYGKSLCSLSCRYTRHALASRRCKISFLSATIKVPVTSASDPSTSEFRRGSLATAERSTGLSSPRARRESAPDIILSTRGVTYPHPLFFISRRYKRNALLISRLLAVSPTRLLFLLFSFSRDQYRMIRTKHFVNSGRPFGICASSACVYTHVHTEKPFYLWF